MNSKQWARTKQGATDQPTHDRGDRKFRSLSPLPLAKNDLVDEEHTGDRCLVGGSEKLVVSRRDPTHDVAAVAN